MVITDDHIQTYERDGTVRIESAFNDWVGPLADGVERVVDAFRAGTYDSSDTSSSFQNPISVWEPFGGRAMALNIVPHDDIFAQWLNTSAAAEMTASVMRSQQVRFWVDASFIKNQPNASEGTPWHNDTCTWPFWGKQMTILWIALTDVGLDDGPLTTVRGSHHGDGRYYSTFFPEVQTPPDGYKPWQELMDQAEAPDADIQTWTMNKGDCLFMHPTTIHGSKPRSAGSEITRMAFSTRWLGDDVVWKPDALTEPMTERLNSHPRMSYGAPPADDVIPVLWPRPEAVAP